MIAKSCLSLALLCASVGAYAQHHVEPAQTAAQEPLSFQGVLNQYLTDPALKGYKLESSVMTVTPGGQDTVSHRHDCELFGYVLEGAVEIGLEGKPAKRFKTGEMFFEKRNVLHSFTANGSKESIARVLLIFIIKDGRSGYTAEYKPTGKN